MTKQPFSQLKPGETLNINHWVKWRVTLRSDVSR